MKRTFIRISLAAVLALSGCSLWQDMENALLTVPPLGKSTVSSFLGTTEGFEAAAEGLHYRLYQLFTKSYIRYAEIPGDLMKITVDADEGDYLTFNYKLEAEHVGTYPRNIWTASWECITETNNLLYYGPGLKESATTAAGKAIVDRGMAYAYFGRALVMFSLCNCYAQPWNFTADHSHPGVPVLTGIPKYTDKLERKPISEVYEQIFKDLEEAMKIFSAMEANYPEVGDSYSQVKSITDCYHASYIACEALLARIYLYMEDWENARKYAASVMEKVQLSPRDEYVDMFRESQDHRGKESIFRLNGYSKTSSMNSMLDPTRSGQSFVPVPSLEGRYASGDVRKELLTYIGEKNEDPVYAGKAFPAICKFVYRKSIDSEEKRTTDDFVFRCSEMYLIHAEASAQLGELNAALDDIRALEARARGITASETGINASGKEAVLALVAEERVLELCYEGHRFFDLSRRRESVVRNSSCGADASAMKLTWPNDRFVLPIDRMELQSNPAMKQNPGYQEYSTTTDIETES